MATDGNKAIIRRLTEVWNQGKIELLDDMLADDYLHHEQLRPTTTREAYAAWVQDTRSALPDLLLTTENLVAEGDMVAARWTFQGTHQGDLLGPGGMISATGKRVTVSGITLFRFADGKLVEDWHSRDDLGFMQQLGLIPMPEQVFDTES